MKPHMAPLKHVCEVIPGFAFKSTDLTDAGIPVVKIGSISDAGAVDLASGQCFPESLVEERHDKFFLNNGDIVLAMTGEGKVGRIRSEQRCLLNQRVCRLAPLDAADQQYLWVAVRTIDYARVFAQLAQGAAQANISGGQLESLQIPWPQKRERGRIAEILSAYDDLIENNRRRMALLEEAARQLYREWFVRLRFPGHEHTRIANGVPEGWERRTLAELCESVDYGYTASAEVDEIGPKFLRITDIVPDVIDWDSVPYCPIEDDRLAKFRLAEGDIVIARTGATVGYAKRLHKRHPEAVFASYLVRLRLTSKLDSLMAGIFVESADYKIYVQSRVGGAAQPNANAKVLSGAEILVPPATIQRVFRETVEPLIDQREILELQNQRLRAARDLLLPRLMSGEIAV